MKLWQKGIVAAVWGGYMTIMGLITFPNHYNFRTYFYDLAFSLGILEQHLQGYIIPEKKQMFGFPVALHASPSFYVALPFYAVGGAWGTLIFQWLAIGVTAVGIFLYAYHRTQQWVVALLSMMHFFGMWGSYSLLSFDWHEVCTGIFGIPFFLLFLEKRKYFLAALFWAFFIGAKETFAIWGAWLSACLIFFYREDRQKVRFLGLTTLLTLLWIGVGWLVYLRGGSPEASRAHLYTYLADPDPIAVLQGRKPLPEHNTLALLRNLLTRPQLVWTLLFESPTPEGVGIKTETYWALLWSGGWVGLTNPIFLLVYAPVFLYKNLSADLQLWGTLTQYSMEFAITLPIFLLWGALRWRGTRYFWWALGAGIIGSHAIAYEMIAHPYSKWHIPTRSIFWHSKHYCSHHNYAKIHKALKLIPREARVSACTNLAPHIPPRFGYYQFPYVGDAEYIALLRNNPEGVWPLSLHEYEKKIIELSQDPNWEKIYDKDLLVIFRRKKP
ncbi:MAG: DUF2079 domain-containing protein [Bacteroidia bacterium]|jgi:uncharacterized membrane protein|nr:DUF2079 domain-containing protein [Bacteroidia bacterium]